MFRESPALHFYVLQFLGFGYLLYRLASRDYTVYGFLTEEMFNYPRRPPWMEIPLLHFTTFQWIYAFIPRPTPEVIFWLQVIGIIACVAGMIGLRPRWCAVVAFLIGSHLAGMMQASNSEVDGGELVHCLLLVLALSPATNFYGPATGFNLSKRSPDHHWPVFLWFLIIGSWYTMSGLNKLIDVGPHWPFVLRLENLAAWDIEKSIFLASKYANAKVAALHSSPAFSVFGGFMTLAGELFFLPVILWWPRLRPAFVFVMIAFHLLVFWLTGINFVGSAILLVTCLDWNALVRNVKVYYDDACGFCTRSVASVKRFDWFNRIHPSPISQLRDETQRFDLARLKDAMGLEDENGEIYYGADAFEQIATRCPLLLPFSLFMKIPGAVYPARYVYGIIARNRTKLGCSLNGACRPTP